MRDGESLIENIVNEAMHEILESDEFDQLLDDQNQAKAGLYEPSITNQAMPDKEDQLKSLEEESKMSSQHEDMDKVYDSNQNPAYEQEIKKILDIDDNQLFQKRMFLQEPFVNLMEFMLEDTLFNLMEEATYEEFDLGQPPKIYIRKDI